MSSPAQSTDAANDASLIGSKSAGADASKVSSKSAQKIAQDRTNENTLAGSGGENPGANVQAGK